MGARIKTNFEVDNGDVVFRVTSDDKDAVRLAAAVLALLVKEQPEKRWCGVKEGWGGVKCNLGGFAPHIASITYSGDPPPSTGELKEVACRFDQLLHELATINRTYEIEVREI
ncbi:MAG: hypothetical protein Q8P39_02065 [Candidatus Yanofskybacteria bacterium]|nr:hypothetical protein [Candidatus Yanofskybacteria bacterium]